MKVLSTLFLYLIGFIVYGQSVNIYVYSSGIAVNANTVYTPFFGPGNVNVTNGGPISNYSSYDIVIFNAWGASFTTANVNDLVSYIQNGGHVVLSTEGAPVAGGGLFMSSVWNALTGQSITETGAGASGTGSPPRFHNSNGPWHLSPDPTLIGSTGSYASFANLNALNVTHQRTTAEPTCGNIEGLSAVYPSHPNLGEGTLYIQGEIQYPYGWGVNSPQGQAHIDAIARMHHTLLTNNQQLLTQLNTWDENLVIDTDFLGNDTLMCKTDFTPFSISSPNYASYNWLDLAGNSLSTNSSYTIQDSGTYIINTVGAFPQCDGVDTIIVRFNPTPVSNFLTDTVCLGVSTTFQNLTQIEAPGVVNLTNWNFGDGNSGTAQSPNYTYSTSGNYNVQLTSTSDQGCSHDTTIMVVVTDAVTASFTVEDGCLNDSLFIVESSSTSSGNIVDWKWNFGDTTSSTIIQSTDQTPSYLYESIGNYAITLIATTDNGCSDTAVVTTNQYPVPEVSFSANQGCVEETISLINNSTISAPGTITDWLWVYGDGSALTVLENGQHSYQSDGVFNVTLTAVSNQGCRDSVTEIVTVFPSPIASFSHSPSCEGSDSTIFLNTSIINQGSIVGYSWDFGDSNSSTSSNPSYSFQTSGSYNVELEVTSDMNCTDDTTIIVRVNSTPVASFSVVDDCVNNNLSIAETSTNAVGNIVDWEWNFGDTSSNNIIQSTVQNPTHLYNQSGSYVVTLIVITDEGCADTVTQTTNRFSIPSVSFSTNSVCLGDSVEFTNTTFIQPSDTITSWQWNYGDGIGNSSVFEQNYSYFQEGIYVVSLSGTSNNGCTNDTTVQVEVYSKPIADFSFSTVCENESPTTFTNLSTTTQGLINSYSWGFGSNNSSSTILHPQYSYPSSGSYTVQLVVETNYGCIDTISKTVNVNPKPEANFIADVTQQCGPLCTQFQDNSIANASSIVNYEWFFSNGDTASLPNPNICFENEGSEENENYDVVLIVTNDLGCKDTIVEIDYITVWSTPIASFDISPEQTDMYNSVIDFHNTSIGGENYFWDYGDNTIATAFEATHQFQDTGVYVSTLIVTSTEGCADTTQRTIDIAPQTSIYIPSAFTPNSDGSNDVFYVSGFAINLDHFELLIFDRWGAVVYSTNNNTPWDGRYKGNLAPQDVYVYRLELKDSNGNLQKYNGHFSLIR